MSLKPTAVTSVSEPLSEGEGCGWLCCPHTSTKPERIKETAPTGKVTPAPFYLREHPGMPPCRGVRFCNSCTPKISTFLLMMGTSPGWACTLPPLRWNKGAHLPLPWQRVTQTASGANSPSIPSSSASTTKPYCLSPLKKRKTARGEPLAVSCACTAKKFRL